MSEKAPEQYQPPRSPPPHDGETRPLPEVLALGSTQVDTQARPPRSIWVHPFDDPTFLEKHPEYKDYDHDHDHFEENPPEYVRTPPPSVPTTSRPSINDKGKMPEKRSFLGKLKDKAIGTKEEREAAREAARQARAAEASALHQRRLERQRALAAQYGAPPQMVYSSYPGASYQQGYGPGPAYGQTRYVYSQQPPTRRGGGFGGGGAALPLLGGLAGGFLLGDLLGGDGFGGGDFGGGDFGGDGGGFLKASLSVVALCFSFLR
ncbi:hypothetical protein Clacol_008175 [Clathrus columnatus]|uniref:WW domain-containing protein n=1 Tax=Clathrus columnatus TaxID=1419009 RepID=A0AAV5AMK0_9AGAM|nr:hypothetical protein Clacol_008175 [Clathrus columnatus]